MFKKWFYKRQLAQWQSNIESVEFELEYTSLQDNEEANRLMQVHKEYSTIIDALKLLINGTTTVSNVNNK